MSSHRRRDRTVLAHSGGLDTVVAPGRIFERAGAAERRLRLVGS